MKKRIRLIILCLIMMITCVVTPYEGIYAAGTVPVKSVAGMTDLDTLEWEPVELTGEEKYDSYLYMDEELYEGSLDLILDEDDNGLLGTSDQTTADTGLYKTQLSGMKLKIYEGFENAGANVTASTGVQIVIPYSTDSERAQYWSQANSEYYAACLAFARDNIELMLNNESNGASIGGGWNGSTLTITIKFTQSKYYSSALQAQVDSKIEEVVAGAPSGRYDAIKYYHDWLVNTNEYDNVALGASKDTERFYRAHSQVGCLIDGTGVCESYAKSFKIFCKKSGIPCVIVTGSTANGDHAWNLVKMEDDQWYLVDCTWDDPTSNNGPVLRYIYFLVTQPDSHINDSRFVYPQTASADYVNKGATTTPTPAPTSVVTPTPAPTSAVTPTPTPTSVVTPTPTSTPTPASNKCGDKMTWNISNSTLTISGEGDMYDYEEYAPWHDYKDKFDKVSVDKWVEKLGKNSFYDCTNIKTLTINGSDTEIKNVESLMYKDDAGQLKWIDDITVMIPTKSKSETWALNNKAPGFMFHGAVTVKSSLIQINDDVGFRCVLIYEAPGVTLGEAYKMIVSLDGETIAVYDDMYQNAIEDYWFYFPAKVSLKDMSKDITFTFLSGANDETPGIRMCEDLVVSADDFIKNQIDYEIEEYKEENEVWWYAIASGLAAETYFGTRSEESAYELLESYAGKSKAYDVTQKINEVNVQTLMNSSKKVSGTQKGVTYLGTSLDLLNSTTIKHYFRIDSEVVKDLCPKINNKNISFQKVDGDIYTLEINKILPTQYSDIFETCVGDLKIIYSVDSYFYDVLSKGKNNELNKLVKFLYLYGKSSASCWKK